MTTPERPYTNEQLEAEIKRFEGFIDEGKELARLNHSENTGSAEITEEDGRAVRALLGLSEGTPFTLEGKLPHFDQKTPPREDA